jgi:lipopolysaccharide assembly protein A
MKLLFWSLVALAAAALALFAASNRATVSLALWPLPFVVELPLYLAVLGALLIGLVAGALLAWIGGRRTRRELRRRGRRIAALERELAATQAQLPDAAAEATPPLASRG